MEVFKINFSKVIQNIREQNNLTQQDLANILHVARSTITNWESGVSNPPDDIKVKIVEHFKVSLDYLFNIKSPNNSYKSDLYNKIDQLTPKQYRIIKELVDEILKSNN